MFHKTTVFDKPKIKRLNMASVIRYEGSYADLILYSFTPTLGLWAKFLSEKAGLGKHSYLKNALVLSQNNYDYNYAYE